MPPPQRLYPLIAVDVALLTIEDDALRVLLVQRAEEPAAGQWALPGGFLKPDIDDDLEAAARRVLRSKVTVDVPHLKEVRTFSGRHRDPRGWSIGVLFYALLPRDQIEAVVRSKVEAVRWADPKSQLNGLAFDHDEQIRAALQVLRDKVEDHALPLHLMPAKFTLTALQRTCEAILGKPLDKGVFRRKYRGWPGLLETGEFVGGAQRPAQLFTVGADFKF